MVTAELAVAIPVVVLVLVACLAGLSAAADKQATQLDLNQRKQTFKVMEEIMANKMYRLTTSTFTTTYFADEKLQDIQMPITATNSALAGAKYWWFKS